MERNDDQVIDILLKSVFVFYRVYGGKMLATFGTV